VKGDRVSSWAAAGIILGIAVLGMAVPAEDGFLIPRRRDWRGWLRDLLPRARRRREAEAGQEAEAYVTELRQNPDYDPMVIRRDELPSSSRVLKTKLLTDPTPGQRQPWPTAENPRWTPGAGIEQLQPGRPRRRAPGDPPTIVIEIMRPEIAKDLGGYLDGLPRYEED
jgi:hypothetical protein